ncbi:MAG: hypothetical protein ACFBSF_20445 [Leptolyngbyaceae cyanobacterium]
MKNRELYARLELIELESDSQLPIVLLERRSRLPQKLLWTRLWSDLKARLGHTGRSLLAFFCDSYEPRILTKRDCEGNDYFVAYDPVTQAQFTFTTERELRVWLDERYYQ